jgi:hypothetical protein
MTVKTARNRQGELFVFFIDLFAGTEVPSSWFRVFLWGDYLVYETGDDGEPEIITYKVNEKTAESVVRAFKTIGNDMMIDYEHANAEATGPNDGGRAAGWISGLEAVPGDGIYATGVTWTPTAAKLIQERDYRYFSPHFNYMPADMRVLSLEDVGLVNKPASLAMQALSKATDSAAPDGGDNPTASKHEEVNPMSDAILKALSVVDEGEAIAAITTLKADAEKNTKDIEVMKTEAAKAKADLEASDTLITSVMEAVGCEDRTALVGKCKACKDNADRADELTKEVEKFKADAIEAEKTAAIEASGLGEDKVAWLKKQNLETVKSYIEDCAKVPDVDTKPQSASAKKDGKDSEPEEWFAEMCKGKGMDEAKTAEEWRAHLKFKAKHPLPQYGKFEPAAPDGDEG